MSLNDSAFIYVNVLRVPEFTHYPHVFDHFFSLYFTNYNDFVSKFKPSFHWWDTIANISCFSVIAAAIRWTGIPTEVLRAVMKTYRKAGQNSSTVSTIGKAFRLPGKHFPGALPLLSRVCSLYGKGPQNNQHQDQTKLRLHSFLDALEFSL